MNFANGAKLLSQLQVHLQNIGVILLFRKNLPLFYITEVEICQNNLNKGCRSSVDTAYIISSLIPLKKLVFSGLMCYIKKGLSTFDVTLNQII